MRIIDRYLLRQFIQVFGICFVSLDGLYIVFDAFSNLDEFLRYTEDGSSLLAVMGEFYAFRSVFFFERISSMLMMIAGMFTVTWIQRHNELTALMAAGISRTRVIRPIITAAICISLATATMRELVIPRLADQLSKEPSNLKGDNAEELKPRIDNETDILMSGFVLYANAQRIHRPNFRLPSPFGGSLRLDAEDAYYRPPAGEREGGYLFREVSRPPKVEQLPSLVHKGRRIVITALDEPDGLKPGECFVVSNVNFEQLAGGGNWRQFSSTRQLIAGLRNPSLGLGGDFGADVRVGIHARIVQPLLDMTLFFLGLPLVLSHNSRNVFVAIGLCLLMCTAFMLIVEGVQYLGKLCLISPALSVWIPLMIFVPIAVTLYERVER